jgi:lipid A 3-O-deacylase
MYHSIKVNIHLVCFLLLWPLGSWAQVEKTREKDSIFVKNRVELIHDNDFLFSTDYYYTTGNFIGFHTLLNTPLFKNGKEQLGFIITHQFYTPSNILSDDIDDFDRPYAGFLGVNTQWSHINESSIVKLELLMGVIGPASGAEGFQNLFHESGGVGQVTAWTAQIENSFITTLRSSYLKEWLLVPGPFSMYFTISPSGAVGTKDMYLQYEMGLLFGNRNKLNNSSAYSQLGILKDEFFFATKAAYRYVWHDAVLEGNQWHDSSIFLVEAEQKRFIFTFEFYKRWKRNDFKLGYNYLTRATEETKAHLHFTISLARNF